MDSIRHVGGWQTTNLEATLRARPITPPDNTLADNTLTVWRDRLILAADLGGTFVFAVEGALAAILGRLDLLGVMVLSFVTALGGGIIRDVLIGATPPSAIRDARYPCVALTGGLLTFVFYALVSQVPADILIRLDAAGLALFAIAGTQKALAFGIQPLIAAALGTVTAVGGGATRDVLLTQVPGVLRVDIYATAALAGSLTMVGCRRLGLPVWAGSLIGGGVCIALRLVSVSRNWNLPTATDW
jgi:uncharacterized membrane protein YeiH